jgi:hypothetical protein
VVQALAFAELFAGGILFLCGYKGYTPAEVVKGEAGAAKPLGHGTAAGGGSSPSSSGAAPGGEAPGTTSPSSSAPGGKPAPTPKAAGSLTWGSLKREIEAHKLTPAQVEAKERQLLGGAALNRPPIK